MADGRQARIAFTDATLGDLRPSVADDNTRNQVLGDPTKPMAWTWMRQVHGRRVFVVRHPAHHVGSEGDGAVTTATRAGLQIQTADCAPIALVAEDGAIGVVHAGWRGLQAGVVEQAITKLRTIADGAIRAWLGPCIHPECYEFSSSELEGLIDQFGPSVASTTSQGKPAFDLPAAVLVALENGGVVADRSANSCTACGGRWYSHRARSESERQVLAAWIDEPS